MKLIPCLICDREEEAINPKAIAKVCSKCDNPENSSNFLKSLNYKKVKEILDKKQLRLTKDGELI